MRIGKVKAKTRYKKEKTIKKAISDYLKGIAIDTILKETGYSRSGLYYMLKMNNIKRNYLGLTKRSWRNVSDRPNAANILKDFHDGYTYRAISKRYNISEGAITTFLKSSKIPLRGKHRGKKTITTYTEIEYRRR